MSFIILRDFSLYQKGQTEEGRQQMQEAMHIFDVLGLPEQVAYYQEHFYKFVKMNVLNRTVIKEIL